MMICIKIKIGPNIGGEYRYDCGAYVPKKELSEIIKNLKENTNYQ